MENLEGSNDGRVEGMSGPIQLGGCQGPACTNFRSGRMLAVLVLIPAENEVHVTYCFQRQMQHPEPKCHSLRKPGRFRRRTHLNKPARAAGSCEHPGRCTLPID